MFSFNVFRQSFNVLFVFIITVHFFEDIKAVSFNTSVSFTHFYTKFNVLQTVKAIENPSSAKTQ